MSIDNRRQKSILAVNLGLAANIVLAALKTSIGILGNSPALLADGINSTSDVAYGIVVSDDQAALPALSPPPLSTLLQGGS